MIEQAVCGVAGIVLGLVAGLRLAPRGGREHAPGGRDYDIARLHDTASPWFHELLAALDAGVICIDARDRILAVNAAAARLFGSSETRMLGRVLIEATGSTALEQRVLLARAGDLRRAKIEIATSRQSLFLEVSVAPADGSEALIVMHDVTALHENERIRREFIGNVSHELRTPLSGIKLMFETLQTIDQPETRAHFYPQILAEVDRMAEIVEHLLDVARAEGGRVELAREPVPLHELVTQALVAIEPRLTERAITLVRDIEPAWFLGDWARISQVLGNLVENALRHTLAGGTITVTTRQTGQWVVLEVADTGCGIPFKDLPHIFERFYVVERSRAKTSAGLGLGLALVKAIVEAHGGTVGVNSEFGVGSCFKAQLPPVPQPDAAA